MRRVRLSYDRLPLLHVFHAVPRAASMSRIVLTRPGEARAAIHSMFGFAIGHNSAIR